MMAWVMMAAALLAAPVKIELAPDQPIPHVYVDDPLIVAFQSDVDVEISVKLHVTPLFDAPPVDVDLGAVRLKGGTLWQPVKDLPAQKGLYRIDAAVESGETRAEWSGAFCRIDRPAPKANTLPIRVRVAPDQFTPSVALAMKAIGVPTVCVAMKPGAESALAAVTSADFGAAVLLGEESIPICEKIAREHGQQIVAWEIDPGSKPDVFGVIAKTLQLAGIRAPVYLLVRDEATFGAILEQGLSASLDGLVYEPAGNGEEDPWPTRKQVESLLKMAEEAGYENLPVVVAFRGVAAGAGTVLAARVAELAGVITGIETDAALAYLDETGFGQAYPYLAGFTKQLREMEYLGRLPGADDFSARVFRNGSAWSIMAWTEGGRKKADVEVGEAQDLKIADARDNAGEAPAVKDGVATVDVSQEPVFLSGTAGNVLLRTAQAELRREGDLLAGKAELKKELPAEAAAVLPKFASGGTYTRVDFFNLLKLFPTLEDLWHAGRLPRKTAIPSLVALACLTQNIAVVEQERNEPFVEPLQSILANVGQRLTLFMTNATASTGHERPDWLWQDVNDLVTKAEKLASQGRPIEANALANVADWRARSLESAARAESLGKPEKEPPPPSPEEKAKVGGEKKNDEAAKPAKAPETKRKAPVKKTSRRRK